MTTPNNQDDELDKILNRLYRVSAETEYSRDRFEPFIFSGVDEAKAAILNWHNKQLEQAAIEARIDELEQLTEFQVSTINIIHGRHHRSYCDRIAELNRRKYERD